MGGLPVARFLHVTQDPIQMSPSQSECLPTHSKMEPSTTLAALWICFIFIRGIISGLCLLIYLGTASPVRMGTLYLNSIRTMFPDTSTLFRTEEGLDAYLLTE